MLKDELVERLKRLDEDAWLIYRNPARFSIVIVGGGALVLLGFLSRATQDIDVLHVPKEILSLLSKYDINCQVQAYVNNFPYNYEDRLVKLPIVGKRIDFYSASLEDIVVAKLYSNRPTDKKDVENPSILQAIDWEKLENMACNENEARASALNESNYFYFKQNYDEYVRRFRP